MLTIEKCLVCGSNKFEPFLVCKDHTVSKESFNIVSCKSCGFKFTNPRPDDSVLGDYYKAESYVSHTNSKKGIINKLYHVVRNHTLKNKIQLISSYVSRGTIHNWRFRQTLQQTQRTPQSSLFYLPKCTNKTEISAGLIPEIRLA